MVATKLVLKGFTISFAFGNSGYDLVSDWCGRVNRIQVKTTTKLHRKKVGWRVNIARARAIAGRKYVPYTKKDADFILVRVATTGDMYVIPVKEVSGVTTIYVCPGSRCKYEKYHEAYNLLK
jgi:hypothetical protein